MSLQEQLVAALAKARAAVEAGDLAGAQAAKEDAIRIQGLIKAAAEISSLEESSKSAPQRPPLPMTPTQAPEPGAESVKAVYTLRFGDDDSVKSTVLTDILGTQYRQTLYDQNMAFSRYLRSGDRFLSREDFALLNQQIFPYEQISSMIKNGFDVRTIKTTMIEAQGTLGGFAVPAMMQSDILRRLPAQAVMRSAGATVVNLTNTNSTEVLEVTGGTDRYTSALRGSWGTESQTPAEKNLTFGMKPLSADVYTYKVKLTQNLVEDAANLTTIVQDEILSTLVVDEDDAFLVGDGVGKPLGLLPGGTNGLSLTEVVTGSASLMTADGIKKLKRGIAAQYRRSGVFIGNSDTYGAIELLVDANGNYLLVDSGNDLTDQDMLVSRRAFESEAMPDVAANAYPLLFGNAAGYWIVERSGMTIARYQDSNTGPNVVEYHVRRRVGGRPVKTWMFCVQKVST